MIYYLHTVIMVIAGIYCCILLVQFFAGRRQKDNRGRTASIVCSQVVFGVVVSYALLDHIYIRLIVVLLGYSVAVFLLFQIRYGKALILSLFFMGLGFLTECIVLIVMGRMFPLITGRSFDLSEAVSANIYAVIAELLLYMTILLVGRILGSRSPDAPTGREWWELFIISFITVSLLVALVLNADLINNAGQTGVLYVTIGMLVINLVVYYLVIDIMKRETKLRENRIFHEKVKSQTAMYHSISENLEKQRRRTHEYKNQIAAIRALAEEKQYEKLQEYVKRADEELKVGTDAIDTTHVIINAILNTKYREATAKGITFVLKIGDLSELKMEEEDIVTILSNLLDNAIEACERREGDEDKVIRFKFVQEGGQAVISVVNSMAAEPVTVHGGFVTTKEDEEGEHGMGIRNVVETVEKYGGRYQIDYDKGEFQFMILIKYL